MMRPPWLAALDLDGTLIGASLQLSPRVRAAVAAVREAGHTVTIATGRSYLAALPFIEMLGLAADPVICFQGAQVRRAQQVIFEQVLPHPTALAAIRWAMAQQLEVHAYLDDRDYIAARGPDTPFYESLHLDTQLQVVGPLDQFLATPPRAPLKLLLVVTAAQATNVQSELSRHLGDNAAVVRSHARFVEVVHPQVNKGQALLALANHLGIPPHQTLAIGDNHNDLPMLEAAQIAIAMGNGTPEVQTIADWIAPTLEEDGAAQALERFLLPPQA